MVDILSKNWLDREIIMTYPRQTGTSTLLTLFLIFKLINERNKYIICLVTHSRAHMFDIIKHICSINSIIYNSHRHTHLTINSNDIIQYTGVDSLRGISTDKKVIFIEDNSLRRIQLGEIGNSSRITIRTR